MAEEQDSVAGGVIVAKAANDYRWKRYVLVFALFVYGMWCIRDGFFRYPRENAAAAARGLEIAPHPGYDIQLNQILAVLLPPCAILFLAWSLYASRGKVRLDGSTLHIPGHPPIPLNAVRKLDRAKWDRKGIATVGYQLSGGESGTFTLDDFIYQRGPIDQIFAQVEAAVSTPDAGPVAFDAPIVMPDAVPPSDEGAQ